MEKNILSEIMKIKDVLPKKKHVLCNYIALNYGKVGMMTISELAKESGVGTTTILRLANMLGYKSYTEFRKALAKTAMISSISSYKREKDSFTIESKAESNGVLRKFVRDSCSTIENIYTKPNVEEFEKAIKLLLKAKNIYALGYRSSKALACYFEYIVNRFYPKVRQLSDTGEFIFDFVSLNLKATDVLVVFSVWPCTKKTIEVAKLCHKLGVPIVLLTNTSLNPMINIADAKLDANSVNRPSGNVALMALIEALSAELGRRTAPASTKNLERVEKVLSENGIIIMEE